MENRQYFYLDGNNQVGPLSLEALISSGISSDTYVWYEGLTEWLPAASLPELQVHFAQSGAPVSDTPVVTSPEQVKNPFTEPAGEKPKDYMIGSIVLTLFCTILGIIAIINSVQAKEAWNKGKYEEARKKSKTARTLIIVGTVGLGLLFLFYVVIFGVFAANGSM